MAGTKEIIFAPYMLFVWLLISLLSGPLNEEFGWRGYSLDKLLERFGFFGATVVLGFIWGIWHFFWSFVPGQAQYEIFNYSKLDWLLFLTVFEIAVSFVIHLVYIKTERSILAGALSHMLCNLLASQLIAPMSAQYRSLFIYVTISVGVIFAIYTMVSKKFNSEVKFQINRIKADKARFGMSENVS
ncbi:MAG: CPBP family intramembrane glutamic endopeptidase [Christensenellaceae bacterium]